MIIVRVVPLPRLSPASNWTLVSDLPVHLLVFWSEKRSPAEEEEGRQGILSVFIFFPPLAKGLREGNWCNQSAGWGFPPPPPRLVWLSWLGLFSVYVFGEGGGGRLCCCCVPGSGCSQERERASERETEKERASERERSRDRVSGAAHSAGTAAAETGRERRSLQAKGGNLHRRLDSPEFMWGLAGSMRWVLFCIGWQAAICHNNPLSLPSLSAGGLSLGWVLFFSFALEADARVCRHLRLVNALQRAAFCRGGGAAAGGDGWVGWGGERGNGVAEGGRGWLRFLCCMLPPCLSEAAIVPSQTGWQRSPCASHGETCRDLHVAVEPGVIVAVPVPTLSSPPSAVRGACVRDKRLPVPGASGGLCRRRAVPSRPPGRVAAPEACAWRSIFKAAY